MKNFVRVLGMATAMTFVLSAPVMAQTTLKFVTSIPGQNPLSGYFKTWAEEVNAELTDVTIDVIDGNALAAQSQVLDRLDQGVIDIGFELQSYYPAKFDKTSVSGLPNMFDNAGNGSAALWDLFESGDIADEYEGYEILALFLFPNADLMAVEPITEDNPISGRKLSATSASRDATIQALGATPVSIKIQDWYQAVQRGVIDGMLQSTSAVPPFSLQEVVNHVVKFPLGGNAGMIVMRKASFDALPAEAQEVIRAHSGREFSRHMGENTEELAAFGAKAVTDAGGTMRDATEAEAAAYAEAATQVVDQWIAERPDGAEVVEHYKAMVEQAKQ